MRTRVKVLFGLPLLLLLAGCDWLKSAPDVPKERRDRLEEIADLQSKIDLAIAKNDSNVLLSAQDYADRLVKQIGEANAAKNYERSDQLRKQLEEAEASLDKAADVAARHRCNR